MKQVSLDLERKSQFRNDLHFGGHLHFGGRDLYINRTSQLQRNFHTSLLKFKRIVDNEHGMSTLVFSFVNFHKILFVLIFNPVNNNTILLLLYHIKVSCRQYSPLIEMMIT